MMGLKSIMKYKKSELIAKILESENSNIDQSNEKGENVQKDSEKGSDKKNDKEESQAPKQEKKKKKVSLYLRNPDEEDLQKQPLRKKLKIRTQQKLRIRKKKIQKKM
jgi:hypothetical protein